MSNIA